VLSALSGNEASPVIEAISTSRPPWGTNAERETGIDQDAVTLAVSAGLPLAHEREVRRVVLVSRDFPLLEGGNAAALLAGLGLGAAVDVIEQLGGPAAALDAVVDAKAGTLVIGSDAERRAGAAAVLCSQRGSELTGVGRLQRSLPVTTRDADGRLTDYADPRLLRELGVAVSLERAGATGTISAVAGISAKEAAALCVGDPPHVPTTGASSPLFALAALVERGDGGRVLAVDQATVSVAELAVGPVEVIRDDPPPVPRPAQHLTPGPDITISLAAYERAFDAKLRLQARRCATCGTLSYPPRYRCLTCGSEQSGEVFTLPRHAQVYSVTTVHVPVPGLYTPYTVVVAELGDTGVRVLAQVTGAPRGSVEIGTRGRLVFRRVAMRSGVPDYGYGFLPDEQEVAVCGA
jgi:uncharacterized OB-fold protein